MLEKKDKKSRSVFSGRFHLGEQERGEVMLKPLPAGTASASDAIRAMGKDVPVIEKRPLPPYTVPSDGGGEEIEVGTGLYALVRLPGWNQDKRVSHLGVVGENYQVITPVMMAEAWDNVIGQAPTGLQFQRGGTTMLMETKIDEFDVMSHKENNQRGDMVQRNFFMMNPTDGGGSVAGGIREIRLICTNGIVREAVTVESFKVKHDNRAFEFMCEWMAHIWAEVGKTPLSATAEQYRRLTEVRASIGTIRWINTALYPLPTAPNQSEWDKPRKTTFAQAMGAYEYRLEKTLQQHKAIEGLWNGGGTGIYGETMWDAVNVFTEFGNYSKGTSDTIVAETINGERATKMQKMWAMVQENLAKPVV